MNREELQRMIEAAQRHSAEFQRRLGSLSGMQLEFGLAAAEKAPELKHVQDMLVRHREHELLIKEEIEKHIRRHERHAEDDQAAVDAYRADKPSEAGDDLPE